MTRPCENTYSTPWRKKTTSKIQFTPEARLNEVKASPVVILVIFNLLESHPDEEAVRVR